MNKSYTISIAATLLVILINGYISVYYLGQYGFLVFILTPFIIGFMPSYILRKRIDIDQKEAYRISFLTLLLACIGLLVFALEGMICILMASPLLIIFTWIGSFLGFQAAQKKTLNPKITGVILFGLAFAFMGFDSINKPQELIPVHTKIIVNSSIDKVWGNVVTFDKIEEPVDWIFKTGISYPTNATIVGEGVGAIRFCNFTTGSFVEPITTWDEPELLQFDVKEQPIPMNEFNPFWDVHPPHLDGYFRSQKGQFKLTKLAEDKTELEGTTWYLIDIHPEFYWKAWSDFIIHRIHERVLNHIKIASED